ncbi:hypothetical protein OPQ81_000583 [Rhizoctonia solani]|nr:hypothetical protein OPQ81_000583 [Rhizoctonia solani]
MPRASSKPGPSRTSCLTCHRRRKKCDLSKPCCKRCLNGGYECLGYGSDEPRARVQQGNPTVLIPAQFEPTPPANPAGVVGSKTPDSVEIQCSEGRKDPASTNTEHDPGPSILGAALLYRMSGPISLDNDNCVPVDSSEDFDRSWPQEQNRLTVYSHSHSRTRQSPRARRSFDTSSGSVPPSVDPRQMMKEGYFVHVINEYHSHRASYWFMTPSSAVRHSMVAQLLGSKRTTWVLYLGARLFQTLRQSPGAYGPPVQEYIGWIDKLDRKLTGDSCANLPQGDIVDRLKVQLELAFFKFAVVDNMSGYTLLQKAVPRFLQLAAVGPNLYIEYPNGNLVVSFPRALSAPRYELRRFIVYDTVASLLLGVPPLVEYGYDGECDSSSYGFEWVHGIPARIIEVISQINSRRASSQSRLVSWQALEARVLAWQTPFAAPDDGFTTENTDTERLAVQESWRYLALIYIYMGVCKVSSHDSRVQASVRRIFELGEMVANLPIGVHMFPHCVIAGVAARLEKHRVFVHQMLLSFRDSRVWLFRGPQFGEALYHLWHGVGSGGAPVTWDDYVHSRCAVAPI